MKIPFDQMVIGLDKIMFGADSIHYDKVEDHADAVKAYLEGCGWSWDLVIEEMSREEIDTLSTKFNN